MRELSRTFMGGKECVGGNFRFMGCEVDVRDEIVELSMWDYLENIVKIRLTEERHHQRESTDAKQEEAEYRSLTQIAALCFFPNCIRTPVGRAL